MVHDTGTEKAYNSGNKVRYQDKTIDHLCLLYTPAEGSEYGAGVVDRRHTNNHSVVTFVRLFEKTNEHELFNLAEFIQSLPQG